MVTQLNGRKAPIRLTTFWRDVKVEKIKNKLNFMKKITNIIIGFYFILFAFNNISCVKSNFDIKDEFKNDNFVIPNNFDYSLKMPNGLNLTASDIFSRKLTFRRKISINSNTTFQKLPDIFITFKSSENDVDIYDIIRNKGKINGTLVIETEGIVVLSLQIDNSEWVATTTNKTLIPMSSSCTVTKIHDCVSKKIHDMNWLEYGACLLSAPECYALLWASCSWDNCFGNGSTQEPHN